MRSQKLSTRRMNSPCNRAISIGRAIRREHSESGQPEHCQAIFLHRVFSLRRCIARSDAKVRQALHRHDVNVRTGKQFEHLGEHVGDILEGVGLLTHSGEAQRRKQLRIRRQSCALCPASRSPGRGSHAGLRIGNQIPYVRLRIEPSFAFCPAKSGNCEPTSTSLGYFLISMRHPWSSVRCSWKMFIFCNASRSM